MAKNKGEIQKDTAINRSFAYKKDGVSLSFVLRIDNPSELEPFKDCLIVALEDVELELARHKQVDK